MRQIGGSYVKGTSADFSLHITDSKGIPSQMSTKGKQVGGQEWAKFGQRSLSTPP